MSDLALRAIELSDMVKALRRELTLAQEARLAAELRAEGLVKAVSDLVWFVSELLPSVDAILPATHNSAYTLEAERWHGRAEEALADLIAAYPALAPGAEPAGEVSDG